MSSLRWISKESSDACEELRRDEGGTEGRRKKPCVSVPTLWCCDSLEREPSAGAPEVDIHSMFQRDLSLYNRILLASVFIFKAEHLLGHNEGISRETAGALSWCSIRTHNTRWIKKGTGEDQETSLRR